MHQHVDPLFGLRFGPLTIPGARRSDPPLARVESVRVRLALGQLLRTARAVSRLASSCRPRTPSIASIE